MDINIINKWDANRERLRKYYEEHISVYRTCDYVDVVKTVVKVIVNDKYTSYNYENITVVDDGDWQGTQLFIIPEDTYQPGPEEYLVTYEYYGTCSGCDTLMAIQEEDESYLIDGLMSMSLHLIQQMKFIYEEDK